MNLIISKYRRLSFRLKKASFDRAISGIESAGKVFCAHGGPTIVTMLGKAEIISYLLAIKSLARFLTPGSVVILNDGTLTTRDEQRLTHQIPEVQIVKLTSVSTGRCQRGGCWERLCLIADLCRNEYVLQLDSDTLTLRRPVELIRAVEERRSFTMPGDSIDAEFQSFEASANSARTSAASGFQLDVERMMGDIEGSSRLLYVRGCAALSGFSPQSISLPLVEAAHSLFESSVGADAWRTWGSEQIASNYLIANTPLATVLRVADYTSHFSANPSDKDRYDSATIIHFLGSHRFDNGTYIRLGKRVLSTLG